MWCEVDEDEFQRSPMLNGASLQGIRCNRAEAVVSQPIKTFTCIICGLSTGPVLCHFECV